MDESLLLRSSMEDAGCDETNIARAEALFAAGAKEDLIRCLRSCRSEMLAALHERQKELDRMDLLIRRARNWKGEIE